MNCSEIVELVTEYIEGLLPPEQQSRFESHLADCQGCRNYVEQMRMTIRLTGKLGEESLSDEIENEMLKAFRKWKDENQKPGT